MPFDEEPENLNLNKKSSLKINNSNSIFSKKEDITQSDFEKKIGDIESKSSKYSERAAQLSVSFRKILDDKTLSKNKNVFQTDIEKQTLESLIQLSMEMNEDENEREAIGATGLIALLLKSILIQRDRINTLEYNASQLENKLLNIEKTIGSPLDKEEK